MKKNYKILISIGIVLVVAITSGIVFQVNKKISYETAIRFIKAGQLSEANEILNNLKKYKNTEILLKYIDALKISKEYPSIVYIQANSINAIPIDYSGDLSKEINDYRMQIKQMETDSIKREEEAIIEIFKKGDYDGMATKCFKNNRYSVLYYYAQAIISEKKGDHDMAIYYLASEIPSNYSGLMADEVHQTLNTYSDEIKQEKKLLASIEAEKSKKYPEIGMTEEQLLCSKWEKPIKVNKTTTSFGISEQWVYSADRYVYLKNGIVTAIQQ